jgi:colicin import membrane protein
MSEARSRAIIEVLRSKEEVRAAMRKKLLEEKERRAEVCFERLQRRRGRILEHYRKENDDKKARYMARKAVMDEELYKKKIEKVLEDNVINERIAEVNRQKDEERRRKAFILKLKKDERDQNAALVAAQKERKREKWRKKMECEEKRVEIMEMERQRLNEEKQKRLTELERERSEIVQTFREDMEKDKFDPKRIQSLAERYEIDIDSI